MQGAEKALLRDRFAAGRRSMTAREIDAARATIRDAVLTRCAAEGWLCVAAYEPLRTEPGSRELLAALHGRGVSVLVPLLLPGNDLDWVHWHPDPERPRSAVGMDAIGRAQAILVPALAVAQDGTRLGRGGGSYDRALSRASAVPTAALLYEDELVESLPADPWDRRVTAVVRPSGWHELTRGGNTRIGPGR